MQGNCLDKIYYASRSMPVPHPHDLAGDSSLPNAPKRHRINATNEKSPAAGEIWRHIRA
jgi:hypothetical protein